MNRTIEMIVVSLMFVGALWVVLLLSSLARAEEPKGLPITCVLATTTPDNGRWDERYPAASIAEGMKRGKEQAARWWGQFPGSTFELFCIDLGAFRERIDQAQKSPEGGGHAGLHWRMQP